MKRIREAKPTLLFTSYFTINTSFLLLLEFFSLNQHRNHVQIFISAFCIAAAAILVHRNNPNSNLLKDDISASSSKLQTPTTTPFLDHDRETITDVDNCSEDYEFVSQTILSFQECKRIEFDDDDERETWKLCGYEGDDEDDGEYEDEDFSKKIEAFIAGKKREWREEIIRERLLLCIEGAKFSA